MTFFVIKRIEKLPSAFLHLLKTEIFKFKIRFLFCFILYLWTTGKDFSNIFNLINGSIQHFWQTVTNTIIYWDWVGWNTSKRYLWFVSSQHTHSCYKVRDTKSLKPLAVIFLDHLIILNIKSLWFFKYFRVLIWENFAGSLRNWERSLGDLEFP